MTRRLRVCTLDCEQAAQLRDELQELLDAIRDGIAESAAGGPLRQRTLKVIRDYTSGSGQTTLSRVILLDYEPVVPAQASDFPEEVRGA